MVYTHFVDTVPCIISVFCLEFHGIRLILLIGRNGGYTFCRHRSSYNISFLFRISWDTIHLEDWKERCIHIL